VKKIHEQRSSRNHIPDQHRQALLSFGPDTEFGLLPEDFLWGMMDLARMKTVMGLDWASVPAKKL
jgi:hypothetical protein